MAKKTRKKAFHVFAEGTSREPGYFDELKRYLSDELKKKVTIKTPINPANKPKQLLELCKKELNDATKNVSFWLVFDRDNNSSSDILEVIHEINTLRTSQYEVDLAFSTPCFECWLLLHFVETPENGATCKQHKAALNEQLGRDARYESFDARDFANLDAANTLERAAGRAKTARGNCDQHGTDREAYESCNCFEDLEQEQTKDLIEQTKPFTTMDWLIEKLLKTP